MNSEVCCTFTYQGRQAIRRVCPERRFDSERALPGRRRPSHFERQDELLREFSLGRRQERLLAGCRGMRDQSNWPAIDAFPVPEVALISQDALRPVGLCAPIFPNGFQNVIRFVRCDKRMGLRIDIALFASVNEISHGFAGLPGKLRWKIHHD